MNFNLNKELSEEELTLFYPFKVTSADADMNSRFRLGSLVNVLIQSAISSADSLGFGFGGLRQQNLFWVLSRLTVEISQPLKWHQSGNVETWPKNIEKILYLRDFLIRDQNKQTIAKATSGWLPIDLESKRAKPVDGIANDYFTHLKDKHALNSAPEKLFPVRDGQVFEINTGFFDIDLNGHVTSTRYVDWMMNTFSIEFHKINYPKKLSINFLKETLPGDTIQLYRNDLNSKVFSFEGFNKTFNASAFRGLIEF